MRIGAIAQWLGANGGGVSEAMRMFGDAMMDLSEAHELHVFAPADAHSREAASDYAGWHVHTARALGSRRFDFSPGLVRALIAADLDVLHVHGIWQGHGLAALIWRIWTGRPLVVSPHGMLEPWILQRSRRLKQLVSKLFQDRLMRRASAIHVLTEREREQVRALYSGPAQVELIPNFVPSRVGEMQSRPIWWRKDFDGRQIFLFFGRLHSKKSVDQLLVAWESKCAADQQFAARAALVLCGWIDDLPDFESNVADLAERTGNVLYAGSQFGQTKWQSMAGARWMILPSKSEGLPIAILESWSLGVPTIMTPECNLSIGFEAGAALGCGPDAGSIAAALGQAFAETDEQHRTRSRAARALVEEMFSRRNISQRLEALYCRLVGTKSSASGSTGRKRHQFG